ncbi:MAG: potassium transporter Kup [Hyphomicrobiales bacterium]
MKSENNRLAGLILAAMGVVYGDIGTSPLYALRETFAGHHPLPVTEHNIFGILSLVFWTITILVSFKYVLLIMRADNHGEGGSLTLLTLVTELTRGTRTAWVLTLLGIFAAALFYGDSMITPAISVLSAVEGLEVLAPHLDAYVIPITIAILTGLFFIQKRGTGTVGLLFGPIMAVWFAVLAVVGLFNIVRSPSILLAINPAYAIEYLAHNPLQTFFALGSVFLAATGAEALYTDMGHFGKPPIRIAWFSYVKPALVLNYFGQGALLLTDPTAIKSPFFLLVPDYLLLPLVILATLATVIASQAVISGAFSVARQAVQLGFLPRMLIIHTSGEERGQIYVPFMNWTLFFAVIALVLGFRSSSNLAAAYGLAVTGTMMIDTVLIAFVMGLMWRWPAALVALIAGSLFVIDFSFFAANAIKIPQGGWFPLIIASVTFVVLTTWKRGRELMQRQMAQHAMPVDLFLRSLSDKRPRAHGTAVFLTSRAEGVPVAMLHNLKHNQTVHERVVFLTVQTSDTPYVTPADRLELQDLGRGFYRLLMRYGFMETPDVPAALTQCQSQHGMKFDMMRTSFFLSRETIVPSFNTPGMALWREKLFAFMALNAVSATSFFKIPTGRVVELGTQVEI